MAARVIVPIEARVMHAYQWTNPGIATLLLGIVTAVLLATVF